MLLELELPMNRMKSYQETEMCLVPMSWYVSSKLSWTGCFYHYVWLAFPSVEGLAESNAIGAKVETVLLARLWLQRNNRRLESCFEWNSRCWNRVVMVRYKQRSMIYSGSIRYDWCSYSFMIV